MNIRKRFFAILMSLTMVLTYMPGLAFALEGTEGQTEPTEVVQTEQTADAGSETDAVPSEPVTEQTEALADEQVEAPQEVAEEPAPAALEEPALVHTEEPAVNASLANGDIPTSISWSTNLETIYGYIGDASIPGEYYGVEGNSFTLTYTDGSSEVYSCIVNDEYGNYGYYLDGNTASQDLNYRIETFVDNDSETIEEGINKVRFGLILDEGYLYTESFDVVGVYEDPREVEYWSFSKKGGSPLTIEEGTYGYNNEDENGNSYFLYVLDPEDFFEDGDTVTVKYKDNEEPLTYTYYGWDDHYGEMSFARDNEDGSVDKIDYKMFKLETVQDKAWNVGDTGCYFLMSFKGVEYQLPFEIIENSISSISFARDGYDNEHPITFLQNVNGNMTEPDYEGGESYFCYEFDFAEGDQITLSFSDPDKADATYEYRYVQNEEHCFVNVADPQEKDLINAGDIYVITNDAAWEPGTHTAYLTYNGVRCPINVVVEENPVESIAFSREGYSESTPLEMTEYVSGGWQGDSEERYFWYYITFEEGDVLTVNDEQYIYQEHKDYNELVFVGQTSGDVIKESEIEQYSNDATWEPGEHVITLRYKGAEFDVSVNINANSVESFSFSREGYDPETTPISMIENVSGGWQGEGEGRYFWYYITFEAGDVITVNGEDYTYQEKEGYDELVFVGQTSGNVIYERDIAQFSNDTTWEPGIHTITLSYGGCEFDVNVNIEDNIVQKIEFARPSLTEDAITIPYIFDEGDYAFNFEAGDVITVTYLVNDGIYKVNYTFVDEERDGEQIYGFETSGNYPEEIPLFLQEDETFWTSLYAVGDQPDPENWELGTVYNCELSYMGSICYIPVKIVKFAKPVSMTWTYNGDQEAARGIIGTSYIYGEDFYYAGDEEKSGNELVITFDDNSTQTYICKDIIEDGEIIYTGYFLNGDTSGGEKADFNSMFTAIASNDGTYDENLLFEEGTNAFYIIATVNGCDVVAGPYTAIGIEDPETPEPEAKYHEEVPATCTEDGIREYWQIGDVYYSDAECTSETTLAELVIPATGHDWDEPTYTWSEEFVNQVTASRICQRCGEIESETVDGAAEMDPVTGDATYTAEFSNEAFTTQTWERKHEHEWLDPEYEWSEDYSSCTATRKCSWYEEYTTHIETETVQSIRTLSEDGFNDIITASFENQAFETQSVMTSHEHHLKHVAAVEATETSNGNIEHWVCEGCGRYFSDNSGENEIFESDIVIPATGEDPAIAQARAALKKCIAEGDALRETVVSGQVTYTDESYAAFTAALENAKSVADDNNASAEELTAANNQLDAARTGLVEVQVHVHEWGDATYTWSEDNTTCTASRSCIDCDAEESEVSTASVETKESTCEEEGKTTYTANFENTAFETQVKEVILETLEHDWDEGVVTKEATCTTEGIKTFNCKNCEATKEETIPVTKHDLVMHGAVSPTCTEAGNIAYYQCSMCEKIFSDKNAEQTLNLGDTVLPKKGHNLSHVSAKDADCTNSGYEEHWYCDTCEGWFSDRDGQNPIEPTYIEPVSDAHDWGNWVYSSEYYHMRACNNNTEHKEFQDHVWNDGVITKEATVDEPGEKTYTCSVCGGTKVETLDIASIWTVTKDSLTIPFAAKDNYITVSLDDIVKINVGESDARYPQLVYKWTSYWGDKEFESNPDGSITLPASDENAKYKCQISDNKSGSSSSVTVTLERDIDYNREITGFAFERYGEDYLTIDEYANGYYSKDSSGKYFYYRLPLFQEGDKLILHTRSGDKVYEYKNDSRGSYYNTSYERFEYKDPNGEYETISFRDINWSSNQSFTNQWKPGDPIGKNYFYATYQDCTAKVPVSIKAMNTAVRSIDLIPQSGYIEIDNFAHSGHTQNYTDGNGNTSTLFVYDIYSNNLKPGDKLVINGSDTYTLEGRSGYGGNYGNQIEYFFVNEVSGDCIAGDALEFSTEGKQLLSDPWLPGDDNRECIVSLFGASTIVPVRLEADGLSDVAATEPTCTTDGVKAHWKGSDGKLYADPAGKTEITLEDVTIPASHRWIDTNVLKQPTADEAGTMEYLCTSCFETKTEEIPKLDSAHNHNLVKVDAVAATCAKHGQIDHWHCSDCGLNFADKNGSEVVAVYTDIDESAHQFTEWNTSYSDHDRCCKVCNIHENSVHKWDEGVVVKESTYTEHGQKKYTCTVCGYSKIEQLDLLDDPDAGFGIAPLPDEGNIQEIKAGEKINITDLNDGKIHTYYFVPERSEYVYDLNLAYHQKAYYEYDGFVNNCDLCIFTDSERVVRTSYGSCEHSGYEAGKKYYVQFRYDYNDYQGGSTYYLTFDVHDFSIGEVPEDVSDIALGEPVTISDSAQDTVYSYRYIPDRDVKVSATATSAVSDDSVQVNIFEYGTRSTVNQDTGTATTEKFTLEAGKTYYIQAERYYSDADKADLTITLDEYKAPPMAEIDPDSPEINLGELTTVNIEERFGVATFKFVPEQDGKYLFRSYENEYRHTTEGAVCLIDRMIEDCETVYTQRNSFGLVFDGKAGTAYYLQCKFKASNVTGSFDIKVDKYIPEHDHVAGDPVRENEVPATCDTDGSYDEVVYCTLYGEEISRKTVKVPATGHSWGDTVYEWASDNSTVTATRTCITDSSHVDTETSTVEQFVKVPATINNPGLVVLTAKFNNPDFKAQTKEVEIPKLDHEHDLQEVKAVAPTCTEPGNSAYWICKVDECAKWFSDEKGTTEILDHDSVIIPAKGHTPDTAVRENEVPATCTEEGSYDEVVYCKDCNKELSRETKSSERIPHALEEHAAVNPTCVGDGNSAYWSCTVCGKYFSDAEGQTEIAEGSWILGEIDHTWDATDYSANDTMSHVTATHICTECGTNESETVALTATIVKPTCDTDGSITYTSSAFEKDFEIWTSEETIPATGHDWNEPVYRWSVDNTTVTATRTCKNDSSHSESETANVTSEVTKQATSDETGLRVFTATFSNEAFAAQTKEESLPKVVTVEEGKANAEASLLTADEEVAKAKASSTDALDQASALDENSDPAAVDAAVESLNKAVEDSQKAMEAAKAAYEAAQAYYDAAQKALEDINGTSAVNRAMMKAASLAKPALGAGESDDPEQVFAEAKANLAAAKLNNASASNSYAKSQKAAAKIASLKATQAIEAANTVADDPNATEAAKAEAAAAAKSAAEEYVQAAKEAEDTAAETENLVTVANSDSNIAADRVASLTELTNETGNISDDAANTKKDAEEKLLTASELAAIADTKGAAETAKTLAEEAREDVAAAKTAVEDYHTAVNNANTLAQRAAATHSAADIAAANNAINDANTKKAAADEAVAKANTSAANAEAAAKTASEKLEATKALDPFTEVRESVSGASSTASQVKSEMSGINSSKSALDVTMGNAVTTRDTVVAAENARIAEQQRQAAAAAALYASLGNAYEDPTLPKVSIKAPKKAKKAFTPKWKKLSKKNQKKVTKIEYEYSMDPTFSTGYVFRSASKKSTGGKKIKVGSKMTYYVRAHTYVIRGGVKYVSPWSKVKKVKTK